MPNKSKRKIKKDVRFDEPTLNFIDLFSKESHLNFSESVRIIIDVCINFNDYPKPVRSFDNNDKRFFRYIFVLYSRSATNLNQSAHALNKLKNLSWMDLDQVSLLNKLNMIDIDLNKVRKDFEKCQTTIDDFIDSQDKLKK